MVPRPSYRDSDRRLLFVFPGQGSQHAGMGKALAEHYTAAREVFRATDELLGISLGELCFEGPEERLTDTINAQPALFASSMAALGALQEEIGDLPRPVFFAGHSMGEYSALAAAGCISFADGLRLVRERGRLMKQAGVKQPGRMAAVIGLTQESVAEICTEAAKRHGGVAQIANDNCPGQLVISGDETSVDAAMAAMEKAGARRVVPLAVSIAAHCPLMEPAAAALKEIVEATEVRAPAAPVIGNTSGRPLDSAEAIRGELSAQLTGSVRWRDSMAFAVEAGVDTVVELGPGAVLTGLMRRIERKVKRVNVADADDVRAFGEQFA